MSCGDKSWVLLIGLTSVIGRHLTCAKNLGFSQYARLFKDSNSLDEIESLDMIDASLY